MNLGESLEDYLEAILVIGQKVGEVHSVDVAKHVGFSKASVSRAVKILRKKGYLLSERNGVLHLTEKGFSFAEEIYERHQCITEILIWLGVDEEVAAQDACRIEHVISCQSFRKIREAYRKNINSEK